MLVGGFYDFLYGIYRAENIGNLRNGDDFCAVGNQRFQVFDFEDTVVIEWQDLDNGLFAVS